MAICLAVYDFYIMISKSYYDRPVNVANEGSEIEEKHFFIGTMFVTNKALFNGVIFSASFSSNLRGKILRTGSKSLFYMLV